MKAYIRHIGLIDHANRVHAVTFQQGVNVVTGKSSTGKSALIEIFDYCFGSSEFTVPEGEITKHAVMYFVVINVKDTNLVLARRASKSTAFFREEFDESIASRAEAFSLAYFDEDSFVPIEDFKKQVGRRFGLIYTDVDEDLEARRRRRNQSHAATPTIRSFTSFMLQHQNLVANKHAIFYRFDEEKKKQQVIDGLKIFLSFVQPKYFQLAQELADWERALRVLELQLPKAEELNRRAAERVELALAEYSAISGTTLVEGGAATLLADPSEGLRKIRKAAVTLDSLSEEHVRQRELMESEKSKLLGDRRSLQRKHSLIKSSIEDVERYIHHAEEVPVPYEVKFRASQCPFCKTDHTMVETEANRLAEAIDWLNTELERSAYMPLSLLEEENIVKRTLEANANDLALLEGRIASLDRQAADLSEQRAQFELAVKAKVSIEVTIEGVLEDRASQLKAEITDLKVRIQERRDLLRRDYDVQTKLRAGEKKVGELMGEIGSTFEFEEAFQPINLQFSFDTFDLWHEVSEGERKKHIYLRSMGSGANWLYSHVTLFLALHRYFCSLGEECLIPSILFLDQPSQVYFPTVLDTTSEFDAKAIAEKNESRRRHVDEDVAAVANLFSRLVEFCDETKRLTGIEPQIIVSDHADNLHLAGPRAFQSLVRAKWRDRGLVRVPSADVRTAESIGQSYVELLFYSVPIIL